MSYETQEREESAFLVLQPYHASCHTAWLIQQEEMIFLQDMKSRSKQ